jgi:dephospho-CoA kinase
VPTHNILDCLGNEVFLHPQEAFGLPKASPGKPPLSLLPGMMGAGKTTIGRLMASMKGVAHIDADRVAKQTVWEDNLQVNIPAITRIFGQEVFVLDGEGKIASVDLDKIRDLFFPNPSSGSVSGSAVRQMFMLAFGKQIQAAMHAEILSAQARDGVTRVVVENAVAIKNGWLECFDWNHVICVVCNEGNQLKRLLERPGVTVEDHLACIEAQLSPLEKLLRANIVIITNGELSDLPSYISQVIDHLGA